MKGVDEDHYIADNLIGTPDEVCAKVATFEEAGLDAFYATLFVANTVDEMLDQMRLFARYVLPAFPRNQYCLGGEMTCPHPHVVVTGASSGIGRADGASACRRRLARVRRSPPIR